MEANENLRRSIQNMLNNIYFELKNIEKSKLQLSARIKIERALILADVLRDTTSKIHVV